MKHTSKQGWYYINGKKIYFRSMWEANYALYLDFLIEQKKIKEWAFEIDTFYFLKIKRGVRSYKPDFRIKDNKDEYSYHEVKGYMDAKSNTKLKRMRKYYPEIEIVLIDKNAYYNLKNTVGKMLNFYEVKK